MADDGHGDGGYNDIHRTFLQALLARQTITYAEAKPLLAAIQTAAMPDRPTLAEDVTREDFDGYVHAINAAVSPFDLEVRSTLHQATRQQVYALVNTTSDALTQLATSHSPDEIAFVKRVLDAMFDTHNTPRAEVLAVSSMQALKCAKPPAEAGRRDSGAAATQGTAPSAALTLAQAEKVMASMVAEGWLELSAAGYYALSPRALMELRGWLVDTYNDQDDDDDDGGGEAYAKIKFCHACRDIVTVGQRCPDLECQARLHNHCVRNMFRAQGNQEKCPLCQTDWASPPPVGEKAAAAASRRSAGGITGVRRSGVSRVDEHDDVE